MQKEILPRLIELFSKIQFVITTHSPLFVLGLNDIIGEDNYSLFDIGENSYINSERYKDFEVAYTYFRNTKLHEQELERKIKASSKPLILFEGKTDVIYIRAAIISLGRQDILDIVDIDFIGRDEGKSGAKGGGSSFLKSLMVSD